MSDRFNYIEFGEAKPASSPPVETEANAAEGTGWKPLRLRAVEVIGDPGTEAGQFDTPTGLAVDPFGSLYVADSKNHRVQRITPSGDVWLYGQLGNQSGQLWEPQDVAVDPTGQFFYVAEQGNNRVQCFRVMSRQPQGAIGGLRAPSGVDFDRDGMLWIADTGNGRALRVDTRNGQFLGALDKAVGIQRPIAIACDQGKSLFLTDGVTRDVVRCTHQGVFLRSLGEHRRLAEPHQAAVDAQGRLYLVEAEANRLHVFDANGNSLITFDTPSSKLGPMKSPRGVALGPNGEIYVADTLNHRVLRLTWD